MLKRLYVDNFRSLVNFEFKPGAINLLLGENGSGKSTVFEVLWGLRDLIVNRGNIPDFFGYKTLTRWQTLSVQTFEIDLKTINGLYKYRLTINQIDEDNEPLIQSEKLVLEEQVLLDYDGTHVQLFSDSGQQISIYPFAPSQSSLSLLPERNDNTKHIAFRNYIFQILIVAPQPTMDSESRIEVSYPNPELSNFVNWYRYLVQDTGFSAKLNLDLAEVLSDFDALILDNVGRSEKLLRIRFKENGKNRIMYDFDELSDGQRMLIMLYTLLNLTERDGMDNLILCIDEPDNFVALREIQPWLGALHDKCIDSDIQVIIISHHPETINYLLMPSAMQIGYWFERNNIQATQIKIINTKTEQNELLVSELMARGWFPNA